MSIRNFSDYIIYIDESGDPDQGKVSGISTTNYCRHFWFIIKEIYLKEII